MPRIDILRQTVVKRTARVMQLEGLFDMQPTEHSGESWSVDITLPEQWNIGLIVGPSGAGKTTIARELFGEYITSEWQWSGDKSIVDDFPKAMSIKDITALLSSVGFSSPPHWLRPFNALSNGEQFRVSIARTLAESPDIAVVDEFTSVVDRTVAKIGSAAIAKTVRKRNQKFIAVTCHYDVLEWLEPDWVYQPHTGELLVGRSLHQRPKITFTVRRVHHSAWRFFGRFHYLDHGFNKAAYCFCAFIDEQPVAFCAVLSFPHATSPGWRFHRLVCHPDYQGIGIGVVFADYVGSIMKATGKPVRRTLAHPAVIHAANKSPVWKMTSTPKLNAPGKEHKRVKKTASDRLTASFEYVGPAIALDEARKVFAFMPEADHA